MMTEVDVVDVARFGEERLGRARKIVRFGEERLGGARKISAFGRKISFLQA